ncbi:hypothetical protein AGLY_006650 [Aphis glycines]|uniref:Uncharacterized protein n=1 Tax=Aphis glycines TaxID=307491 RepID=A0A6G0TRP2_APHGL|nr:hypothetical protein AGLY_006650 [Aphis glycines]
MRNFYFDLAKNFWPSVEFFIFNKNMKNCMIFQLQYYLKIFVILIYFISRHQIHSSSDIINMNYVPNTYVDVERCFTQYIDKQENCNKENIGCLHAKSIIKNEENRKNENILKHEINPHADKHEKCNKEKIGCLHAESIIKNEKNRKSENIQKYEEDRIKFYGMLDGLNNEIKKIKELFLKNTNSYSFFNNNNSNNPITNRSTEMSAGEDFIDNEKCRSIEKMMHKNSTDHDLCSKSKFNTNQSIIKGVFQNNEDCMNTQNTYICQNVLQQENDEEFYQIQLSDIKIENLNNMEHFITWQNLYRFSIDRYYTMDIGQTPPKLKTK